ncbi:MAG: pyridoxal phosphate-dependent aminotransferase [Candidatus Moranbacteria bacterium]|nr:pyridoxal phosphate-dependent aminotransferase [Candidatus Moranbacteria bacterium]
MRTNIVHEGADELSYEIRGIVRIAERLRDFGVDISWENIGDPVAKGEGIAGWIKEIVSDVTRDDRSFGYSPTKGLPETRAFIAERRSAETGVRLDAEDILFFNGLGDAISNVYTYFRRSARVIGPSPAYPTHSSAEAAHAGSPHITYALDPGNGWLPDVDDIRNKVRYNPNIAGILIINPDNPTGMVYPKAVLAEIVSIAREYGVFVVSDETYAKLTYGTEPFVPIAEMVGDDVPAIAMRGLSKEVPWPGSRCGWIEVYNKDRDAAFARYVRTLVDAKMLEVCSTTLPQRALPSILGDGRYGGLLRKRNDDYRRRADIAHEAFSGIPGVLAPRPDGAFYYSVVFDESALPSGGRLPIGSPEARQFIEKEVSGAPADKRFAYYLMASTGICVVPLSGFNTDLPGFRMTLLEPDEMRFRDIVGRIADAIRAYAGSGDGE